MNWSTSADIRTQLERLWQRGELLRATVDSSTLNWPLRLTLKAPKAADLNNHFEAVRDWVGDIKALPHVRIEWRETNHRVQGKQRLPCALWIETLDDALALIGKTREARLFQALWQQTASEQPALLPWLYKYPFKALELTEHWPRLLAVVAWMQAHPRPGIYLRQVDAPGIDSKFIESQRSTLIQWLDLALPSEAIDFTASGVSQFARRYGLLDKPLRIRLRLLDDQLPNLPGCTGFSDITLDADSFAALQLPVQRVFITENEVNFLAFPPVPKSIVIFGAGYGFEALARATWLHHCPLHYWGDLDTHGFAILDNFRTHFPHAHSLLMNRQTLMAHQSQWGKEPPDKRCERPLSRLTDEESSLFEDLRLNRIHPRLRLEQERLSYHCLCKALDKLDNISTLEF